MQTIILLLLAVLAVSRPRPRALLVDGLAGGALALQRRFGARALALSDAERARPVRLDPFEPVLAGVGVREPVASRAITTARPAVAPPERVGTARRRPAAPRPGGRGGAPTELATIAAPASSPPGPSLALVVIGKAGGESYPLVRETVVGRGAAADIRIDDPDISRLHVQLTVTGRRVQLIDLGSVNGTFVNGTRCHDALLEPGDVIRLGKRFEARLVGGEE